jgi:hypothetical protein
VTLSIKLDGTAASMTQRRRRRALGAEPAPPAAPAARPSVRQTLAPHPVDSNPSPPKPAAHAPHCQPSVEFGSIQSG